jgi:hypothetical protein
MHRGLVLCLVALLMASAGVASAETYIGLRFAGNGNFDYLDGPVYDSGWYTYREFVVGYGDKFQGEVSIGWSSVGLTWADHGGSYRDDGDEQESWSAIQFGLAGFYPVMEGSSYRVDAGARFQYHSGSNTWEWAPTEQEDTEELSGWSFGPLVRGSWWLGDLPVTLGPEVYLKYTSLKYTYDRSQSGESFYDEEYDVSGFNVDYGFRLDFHFD